MDKVNKEIKLVLIINGLEINDKKEIKDEIINIKKDFDYKYKFEEKEDSYEIKK